MIITDYKRNHSQKTTVSLKYSIWPRLNFSVSFSFFSNYQWKWDYSLFLEDINLQIMYENMLFIYACLHISTIGDICFTIVWWSQSRQGMNYSWNKKNSKNWHTASKTMLWVSNNEGKMYWPLYSEYIYIYKFANSLC